MIKPEPSMHAVRMILVLFAILSVTILGSCAGNKIDKPEGSPLSGAEIKRLIQQGNPLGF
jgi:hypothetical protein